MTRPETRQRDVVRIGHPAGVIDTETRVELSGNNYVVRRATLGRTARRIMEGYVYPRDIDDGGHHQDEMSL
jgi:2-methylaconitate cis-trans-isomerase PrpF